MARTQTREPEAAYSLTHSCAANAGRSRRRGQCRLPVRHQQLSHGIFAPVHRSSKSAFSTVSRFSKYNRSDLAIVPRHLILSDKTENEVVIICAVKRSTRRFVSDSNHFTNPNFKICYDYRLSPVWEVRRHCFSRLAVYCNLLKRDVYRRYCSIRGYICPSPATLQVVERRIGLLNAANFAHLGLELPAEHLPIVRAPFRASIKKGAALQVE